MVDDVLDRLKVEGHNIVFGSGFLIFLKNVLLKKEQSVSCSETVLKCNVI